MKTFMITAENNKKTSFNNAATVAQDDESTIITVNTMFDRESIKGCYKEEIFSDFKIGYGDITICNKCQAQFKFTGKTIEMIFFLAGKYLIHFDGLPLGNSQVPKMLYYSTSQHLLTLDSGRIIFLRINFSPCFLTSFFSKKNLEDFQNKLQKDSSVRIAREDQSLDPEIKLILEELQESRREGPYRKIHTHAMVMKLLLLQIDQIGPKQNSTFLPPDQLKILQVRDYISNNYTQRLTLLELSIKFGTNDFALKKGFKDMFGMTVFNYIVDLKMSKAKQLLLEKKLSVGEISEIIGYKNPQHFSTAFKKKFGTTPSKI